MSTLQVGQIDSPTFNLTDPVGVITADSMNVAGNVSGDRIIRTGSSAFQFIERIPLEGVQMANTVNISGYSTLRWTIEGLLPANTNTTGGPKPWLQVSTDGGTVYANANSYGFHTSDSNANSAVVDSSTYDDTNGAYVLTYWGLDNVTSTGGGSGWMYLFGNKAGVTTRIISVFDYRSGQNTNGSPWTYQDRGLGRILFPDKITNYRLRLTEGSLIANGTITIEGIPG